MITTQALSGAAQFIMKFNGERNVPKSFITQVAKEAIEGRIDIERHENNTPVATAVYEEARRRYLITLN